jgi:hypothetical protein
MKIDVNTAIEFLYKRLEESQSLFDEISALVKQLGYEPENEGERCVVRYCRYGIGETYSVEEMDDILQYAPKVHAYLMEQLISIVVRHGWEGE